MQKYPKSKSTQKISNTGMAPFLEYPCFIAIRPHIKKVKKEKMRRRKRTLNNRTGGHVSK
jgi:hypothetical protein